MALFPHTLYNIQIPLPFLCSGMIRSDVEFSIFLWKRIIVVKSSVVDRTSNLQLSVAGSNPGHDTAWLLLGYVTVFGVNYFEM